MTEFQRIQSLQHKKDTSTDTVVFPFIQSMPFRIREEEHTLIALLILLKQSLQAEPKKRPLVHMTTGYFSLYDDYQHFLIDSDADCKVLVSSPEVSPPPILSWHYLNLVGQWLFWFSRDIGVTSRGVCLDGKGFLGSHAKEQERLDGTSERNTHRRMVEEGLDLSCKR
jgi:hypothetical protein